jgi:signal transduction histidine kinase
MVPVSIVIAVDDEATTAVPAERRAEIEQVLREALANAVRHARASAVTISAHVERGSLILKASDDGVGFDMTAGSAEGHHGLRNMTNRARMLDGRLDIESAPGRGTTIKLSVPLSR